MAALHGMTRLHSPLFHCGTYPYVDNILLLEVASVMKVGSWISCQERNHYQAIKRLEGQLSELKFWKAAAADRMAVAEKEAVGLRKRTAELLSLSDKISAGVAGVIFIVRSLKPSVKVQFWTSTLACCC